MIAARRAPLGAGGDIARDDLAIAILAI